MWFVLLPACGPTPASAPAPTPALQERQAAFGRALNTRFCEAWTACDSPGPCKAVFLGADTCPGFDKDAADACLSEHWLCTSDPHGQAFPSAPEACQLACTGT